MYSDTCSGSFSWGRGCWSSVLGNDLGISFCFVCLIQGTGLLTWPTIPMHKKWWEGGMILSIGAVLDIWCFSDMHRVPMGGQGRDNSQIIFLSSKNTALSGRGAELGQGCLMSRRDFTSCSCLPLLALHRSPHPLSSPRVKARNHWDQRIAFQAKKSIHL